jgi:disulfide bond formation protein DsbB
MLVYCKRWLNALGFLAVCALLLTGFYLQYIEGILPCPLCMLQRFFFYLIAAVFLIAFLHNSKKKGQRVYGLLVFVFSLAGVATAARQLWVQAYPMEAPEVCVPGFQYMFANFPLSRIFEFLFYGSGDCSEVSWTLLGLSIATWGLISFIIFALLGFYQMIFVASQTTLR